MVKGASTASPNAQSMGTQGGGHRWPATPESGCRPRLTPKSLVKAMAISQQPTDLTNTHRESMGFWRPQRLEHTPTGGSNTIKSHYTSGHHPDLNIFTVRDAPSKSARKKERCAKDAQNINFYRRCHGTGHKSPAPAHPQNGHTPPMAGLFRKKKPE